MADDASSTSGLQVREDRSLQEKFWVVQRVGWALMALLVLAALLGATGKGGPLATARIVTPSGSIEYPRIARWQATAEVTMILPTTSSGEVDVELARSFMDMFSIDSVEPEPAQVVATRTGHRFTFDVDAGGGSRTISFHVTPSHPSWPRSIEAGIGEGPPAVMMVTVLP